VDHRVHRVAHVNDPAKPPRPSMTNDKASGPKPLRCDPKASARTHREASRPPRGGPLFSNWPLDRTTRFLGSSSQSFLTSLVVLPTLVYRFLDQRQRNSGPPPLAGWVATSRMGWALWDQPMVLAAGLSCHARSGWASADH